MHEYDEIFLNTCLICHMASTQIQTHQMRLKPIKILKKICTKLRTPPPTPFLKIPNFQNPKLNLHNPSRKDEKSVKNTYVEVIE